jgi:hypothetical protein
MKPTLCALTLLLTAATPVAAGPLDKKQIAADAKWILHLDVDTFKAGKVGSYFINEVLDRKTAKMKEDLKAWLNFDLDWRKIASITAYGSTFQPQNDSSGLLLIKSTGLETQKALEQAMANNNPGLRVQKLESSPEPLYCLNDQGYVGYAAGGVMVVGKTRETVKKGLGVLSGARPDLASSSTLSGYPAAPAGFFFLAVAEGFGAQAQIPPKAAVLKQAEGGRLVAGEKQDRLHLNLDIKAASADVAQQVQQVAQGLVALASLNASQNLDLQLVAQGTKVNASDKLVSLALELPVADVIKKIAEKNKD